MSPTGNFRRAVIVMAALSVPVVSRSAAAQWAVKATGPDVFGNEKVIALVPSSSGDALIIQCDQKDSLYIALIEHGTSSELNQLSEMPSGIPAKLFVKVDQDAVQKFDAKLKQWNTRYLGVVASGRTPGMVAVLREIGSGNHQISVGTEILGSKDSDSFGVLGSASAISTVLRDCKLDTIAAPPDSNRNTKSP